ncbi:hypothetical protein FGB62_1g127 [Gracilaria domingensis]|nr:hypothetical protein FGB62_1g127 [Gracilaria domingensis]
MTLTTVVTSSVAERGDDGASNERKRAARRSRRAAGEEVARQRRQQQQQRQRRAARAAPAAAGAAGAGVPGRRAARSGGLDQRGGAAHERGRARAGALQAPAAEPGEREAIARAATGDAGRHPGRAGGPAAVDGVAGGALHALCEEE